MSNTSFVVVPVTAYLDDSAVGKQYWEASEKLGADGVNGRPAVLIVCHGKLDVAEERRRAVLKSLGEAV